MKINKKPGFVYDEESTGFLESVKEDREKTWQHRSPTRIEERDLNATAVTEGFNLTNQCNVNPELSNSASWSVLQKLPLYPSVNASNVQLSSIHRSDIDRPDHRASGISVLGEISCNSAVVNKPDTEVDDRAARRQISSTRLDFLDPDNSFLTVSSSCRTDTSDMGLSDNEEQNKGGNSCECGEGESCHVCSASGGGGITDLLNLALNNMTTLSRQVAAMQKSLNLQGIELRKMKAKMNGQNSEASDEDERSAPGNSGLRGGSGAPDMSSGRKSSGKSKKERVLEERERTLRLLLEQWDNEGNSGDGSQAVESSDDEVNLRKIDKKMTNKQKTKRDKRVSSILKDAGASFPGDDPDPDSSSNSSGTESEDGKKGKSGKHRVKSGAKVRKRPVVKTELWPHTITNEDEGEDLSSENISLSKFFYGFTFIVATCGNKLEADGRTVLMHAITLVLDALTWSDARVFHNVTMTKIEQGRLEWSADFMSLAKQFVDRKVRQSLKPRGATSSGTYGNRGNSRGFGGSNSYSRQNFNRYGNNFSNSNSSNSSNSNRNYNSNSRSQYNIALVCRLWNAGSCSFGIECKRWHCCYKCFEAGKVGEAHKATECNGQAQRGRRRV